MSQNKQDSQECIKNNVKIQRWVEDNWDKGIMAIQKITEITNSMLTNQNPNGSPQPNSSVISQNA